MMPGMDATVALDPVLRRFRDAVAELYGPVLDRVVLFGSRARGDARPDSDYDVAVFLKGTPNRWAELRRLSALEVRFMDEGVFIEAIPFAAPDYQKRTPIMHEIRKDGLTL
jgi:predicted nucleotidyltransferase